MSGVEEWMSGWVGICGIALESLKLPAFEGHEVTVSKFTRSLPTVYLHANPNLKTTPYQTYPTSSLSPKTSGATTTTSLQHNTSDHHLSQEMSITKHSSSMEILIFFIHLLLCTTVTPSLSSPIKTIVVLVMENRSFDHMLGWMKQINPQINGVDGSEYNPISPSDPTSPLVFFTNTSHYVDADPPHSFQAIREQIFGSDNASADHPPMNGFAQQATTTSAAPQTVMSGFDPSMVAVYKTLVSEFAVFDRWFASVPASTQPNRLFVHSATSAGATGNIPTMLAKGYPQRTIFDNLDAAGVPFGIYYQNIPATLFYQSLRKLKYLDKFHFYGLSFERHAREGKLPGYTVIEQRYMDTKVEPGNDDHPSHDVYEGQMFVKEVYETLRASPQWNETLLVITYDEHGGFYDHVPTPVRGVPSPDGIAGPEPFLFEFDRLGVRVPTIMVSPWIDKGTGESHPHNLHHFF